MIKINSFPHISTLENIETNFKVFAGPGAGKTTWLTSHLERVVVESKRLNKTGKIACITYTNVAADEIVNRLNSDKSRFDISTIHSFLFRNIVKPFSYLIEKDENGNDLFNTLYLDGHEEHIVHGERLSRWISRINDLNEKNYYYLNRARNKPNVITELSSLDYSFVNEKVDLVIRQNRGARIPKSNNELWLYKSMYWSDGLMHHEDVLYFSYLILKKSQKIVEFIRNKFPYIFIDEFQDTNEIQTWIIEKITEKCTKVGVVGDLAQSIYKFAGAKRTDFLNFKDEDISNFKLNYNHRSSKQIIDFLNKLRSDITQEYGEKSSDGINVKVLVGTIQQAISWYKENFYETELYILTRKNDTVYEINNLIEVTSTDLLKEMYSNDSNGQRVQFIHSILMSIKYYEKNDLKKALNELYKPLRRASNLKVLKLSLRGISIAIINFLRDEENRNKSIAEFYLKLKDQIENEYGFNIGSGLNRGKAKDFYEKYNFNDILPFIKVDTKSNDLVRTIHSAKGSEFENILVHFDTLDEFRKYILNSNNYINNREDDCRVYYVGCSRAMDILLISIPEITQKEIDKLKKINVEFEIL